MRSGTLVDENVESNRADGLLRRHAASRNLKADGFQTMTAPAPAFRRAVTPWVTIQELVLPADFRVPAHKHSPPHILVLLSGLLDVDEADGSHACGPRSIRYSPGGDRHDSIRIGGEGAHCLVIEARKFPELHLVERMYVSATDAEAEVSALAQCLFAEPCASPAAVEAKALALFSLVRNRARASHVQHHEWVSAARTLLDSLTSAHAPLADAARHVGRNASVVARHFRAIHGVSVHRYYRRQQLDRAWAMLLNSERSIGSIAAECGFTDQSHLNRAFAGEAGVTPAELRSRARAGNDTVRNWYRNIPLNAIHS